MCKVHDGEPELARLSRLRKSQIKGLLVRPARAPASSTVRPCATRVQARARRHRIEAPWLALPFRPVAALGQEQESECTRAVKREAEEDWSKRRDDRGFWLRGCGHGWMTRKSC